MELNTQKIKEIITWFFTLFEHYVNVVLEIHSWHFLKMVNNEACKLGIIYTNMYVIDEYVCNMHLNTSKTGHIQIHGTTVNESSARAKRLQQ